MRGDDAPRSSSAERVPFEERLDTLAETLLDSRAGREFEETKPVGARGREARTSHGYGHGSWDRVAHLRMQSL